MMYIGAVSLRMIWLKEYLKLRVLFPALSLLCFLGTRAKENIVYSDVLPYDLLFLLVFCPAVFILLVKSDRVIHHLTQKVSR